MADDQDGLTATWMLAGPVAVLSTVGCAVVVAASFVPVEIPDAFAVAACLGALPVLLLSIVTLARMQRRRRDVLSTIEKVAPAAWPLAGLLFVLFWIAAATSIAGSEGDPRARDGRYFVVEHGVSTEISRDEYERQVVLHQRAIAGGAGALYGPGVGLGLYSFRLRSRGGTRARS